MEETKIIKKDNKEYLQIQIMKEFDLSGSLDLRDTNITSLPDNLSVGGYLCLRGTKIKKEDIPKYLIDKWVW